MKVSQEFDPPEEAAPSSKGYLKFNLCKNINKIDSILKYPLNIFLLYFYFLLKFLSQIRILQKQNFIDNLNCLK